SSRTSGSSSVGSMTRARQARRLRSLCPWLVLGFVVGEPRVLTYLHVRGGFRGMGLARSLAALLDIGPGLPFAVEFPTFDVVRDRPGGTLPIGIAHSSHWAAVVRPWHPTE